jgi:alpha-2-macroglobulin
MLSVMLNSYYGGVQNKKIIELKPYSAGCYEGFFVLNDSLKLKLGYEYYLSLEDKDHTFVRNSFRYEQYDLKSETYLLTIPKTTYFHNEKIKIYAAGKDENDLPLISTKLRIQVLPNRLNETKDRQVFVPNLIWEHQQNLSNAPETMIVLPDSIFPKGSMSFKILAEFVSLDNSIQKRELHFSRDIMRDFVAEKPEETRAVNPFQPDEAKVLSVQSSRMQDAVEVKINNPLKSKCWYSFFENNKKLEDGFTQDSLVLKHHASPKNDYSLAIQYIENQGLKEENYSIPFHNKALQIETSLPPVVSPSQEIEVELSVKNIVGKALADVDLMAFSVSKKFANSSNIQLNDFSFQPKPRRIFNHFDNSRNYNSNHNFDLNWKKFHSIFGLDSNVFYQFLYAKTGYFQTKIEAKNHCEFAPFVVVNGYLQAAEIIKVDKEPVYFSLAGSSRFSFGIKAGRHRISIRTKDWLIETEEMVFLENQKLVFSINPSIANPQYKATAMLPSATAEELWMLNNQILWLDEATQEDKIIKQKDKLFPLFKNSNTYNFVGPFFAGSATYERFDTFKIDFAYEPNYTYSFSPSVVKMKERKPMTFFNFQNLKTNPIFDELTMTEAEIRAKMVENLRAWYRTKIRFDNPGTTLEGKGSFNFLRLESKQNLPYYCKVLFKNDDPNFIRIYQGNETVFHHLDEGTYSLYVLFTNGDYGIASDLKLTKNGYNYLSINELKLFSPDEKSKAIEAVLAQKYQFVLSQDAQKIKELFYETYNTNLNRSYANEVFQTGVVSGSDGEPVPGVSVFIKGTARGTQTDINGRFSIYCPSNAVLIFSFVGFETKEALIKNSSFLNITLKEDEMHLDEVVVVGYGIQRRRDMTAAVSSISTDDGWLNGRVAGVQIMREGSPGSGKEMLIKGINSMGEDPIYIIDGVPFSGNINEISPDLLENVEVLKGSAATALYGAKAAGGVLLISTKKKKPKKVDEIFEEAAASIRNNFRDDAFWQPKLKTDKNGKAKFKIKLPDDITNWETTVLGIGQNSETGQIKVNSKAFKSIVAKLTIPKFLIEGDTAEITGVVRNYLTDSVLIDTKFIMNDKNLSQQTHVLKEFAKDSIQISTTKTDTLSIKYLMATASGKSDGELRKILVLLRGVEENQGIFVFSAKDTTFLYKPTTLNSAIKIRIEASPIDILWNETLVLRDYKYLCNEQLASKLKAFLANKKLSKLFKRPFDYESEVVKIIEKITKNQNPKGHWGWWNVSESSDWVSRHVLEALRMAQEMGYLVKIQKVDFAMDKFIFEFDAMPANAQIEAIKIVMLQDTAFKMRSYFERIKNIEKLALFERLDYELLGQKLGFQHDLSWLKKYENQTMLGGLFYGETDFSPFRNEVLSTLKVLELFKKGQVFNEKQQQILRYLFEIRKNNGWRNTYESARILELLIDYFGEIKPEEKGFVELKIGQKIEKITKFPAELIINATDSIWFKTQASPFFIAVSQKVQIPNPEPVSKDFEVKTKLVAKSGKAIKSGETITLSVDLNLTKSADYTMLEIPLPAACEYLLAGDASDIRMKGVRSDFAEKFKEKTNIYFSNLTAGTYHFEIDLVARFSGVFSLNPAKAELMYFPIFFGREGIKKVVVE